MNVEALAVQLGNRRVGWLFRYAAENALPLIRFVPEDDYAAAAPGQAPTLSTSMLADSPEQQRAVWADETIALFNSAVGQKGDVQLPPFFQGLLPEGVFRDHVAAAAACDPLDHFRMLAACGLDLPGAVLCRKQEPSRQQLQRMVTQNQDALELSVSALPIDQDQLSISGMQPKVLALLQADGRYVAPTRLGARAAPGAHIICKLPTVQYPHMPELEDLCLRMAAAAGIDTCQAQLATLADLYAPHAYDLDEAVGETHFLAVRRFDRADGGRRLHHETLCQALGVPPERKYTGATYLDIAFLLLGQERCGLPAVHELLRRIAVNDLLGNPDAHLANFGLIYRDGVHAELSPAYDIVGLVAYGLSKPGGHALHLIGIEDTAARKARDGSVLTPAAVRDFCEALQINPLPATAALRQSVSAAARLWPALIDAAGISARQKERLRACIAGRPLMQGVLRRDKAAAALWPAAK